MDRALTFNKFNWSIFISSGLISTDANFDVISCGVGQLLAEPGGSHSRWGGQITTGRGPTPLAIPEWVTCMEYIWECWARIPTLTEVVISHKGWSDCFIHTGTVDRRNLVLVFRSDSL